MTLNSSEWMAIRAVHRLDGGVVGRGGEGGHDGEVREDEVKQERQGRARAQVESNFTIMKALYNSRRYGAY